MPSSSSPSRTNIKAQAPPERLAKRTAAALDRNAPPAALSQSCAIHSPLLLRPIANTGMASFRIALSGRLTLSEAAGLSSAGNMSINFNLHPSMCAQSRMKSRVSSAHLHKCKIKTAAPGLFREIAKDDVRHPCRYYAREAGFVSNSYAQIRTLRG